MGAFAEFLAPLVKSAEEDWEKALAEQESRLHSYIPSSEQEAIVKARQRLDELTTRAYGLGSSMRRARQKPVDQLIERGDEPIGAPGREIVRALSSVKQGWYEPRMLSKEALFGAITDPIKNKVQETGLDIQRTLEEMKERGTRVTTDPATLPTYYPSVALATPHAFIRGYKETDKELNADEQQQLKDRVLKARQEFEQALSDEYRSSKTAGEVDLLDQMADAYVKTAAEALGGAKGGPDKEYSKKQLAMGTAVEKEHTPKNSVAKEIAKDHLGEISDYYTRLKRMEKGADGGINKALGMYLALASVLGVGSHMAAKRFVEKRDPRYQRAKAIKEMISHRQRQSPMPVYVTDEELPAGAMSPSSPDLLDNKSGQRALPIPV